MAYNKVYDKLAELETDYWSYQGGDTICLDGNYTIEQLKLFIDLIGIGMRENEDA